MAMTEKTPEKPKADQSSSVKADAPSQVPGLHPASSIPPENMTFAAVAAGSSGSLAAGIAAAGALGMAEGEIEYQRRWAKRVKEARGWQKVWRIIWG